MMNTSTLSRIFWLGVLLVCLAGARTAAAQTFTLTSSGFSAINIGGTATATVDLSTVSGFSGSVAFSSTISPNSDPNTPSCMISPVTATSSAMISVTCTTGLSTPAAQYTVTVTGTDGGETETATLRLTVVNVPPDYTINIQNQVSPSSLHAGSGAQATILVTPVASYSGTVSLSCVSVTPAVVAAPTCSFQSSVDPSLSTVTLTNGQSATALMTISTFGTTQNTAKNWSPRIFFAFWLAVPGIALTGAGLGRGTRNTKILRLISLLCVAGILLVLPSCGSSNNKSNNSSGLITPKNSYTLTINGVDAKGFSPGNTTTGLASVSLTVN